MDYEESCSGPRLKNDACKAINLLLNDMNMNKCMLRDGKKLFSGLYKNELNCHQILTIVNVLPDAKTHICVCGLLVKS